MATIEMRSKQERKQQREPIPAVISPERKPVVWKPWTDEQTAPADDGIACPPHGAFFHIVNGVR